MTKSCQADKDGITTINFQKVIEWFEAEALARAADWVPQIAPNTREVGGCCLLCARALVPTKLKEFQPQLDDAPCLKGVVNPLIAPTCHSPWWPTVGYDYFDRANWKLGMSGDTKFAKWECGACGGEHAPKDHLACRCLCMIKPKAPDELEEGEITCVMARVGDHDLDETVEATAQRVDRLPP